MKKLLPFLLVLVLGVGIAITVKANKKTFTVCCDDNLRVCQVINGIQINGPRLVRCP